MISGNTIHLPAKEQVLHANTIPLAPDIGIPVMILSQSQLYPDIGNRTIMISIVVGIVPVFAGNRTINGISLSILGLDDLRSQIFTVTEAGIFLHGKTSGHIRVDL